MHRHEGPTDSEEARNLYQALIKAVAEVKQVEDSRTFFVNLKNSFNQTAWNRAEYLFGENSWICSQLGNIENINLEKKVFRIGDSSDEEFSDDQSSGYGSSDDESFNNE